MLQKINNLIGSIFQKILNIKSIFETFLTSVWNEYGNIFLVGILVFVYVKFKDLIIDFITKSSQRLFQKMDTENQALENKINTYQEQADNLVNNSNNLPTEEKPITPDWYKEEK